LSVQKANLAHSCLYYIDPPKYWKKSFNIPFFLKPATLVYKSSFPKDVMMKALKEYAEAQDAQMATETSTNDESVANQTSDDVSDNSLPNSDDLKPQKSVVNESMLNIPSLEGVGMKQSTSMWVKAPVPVATDSDSPPAPKRQCYTSVQSTKVPVVVAIDSDSPPAPKRQCYTSVQSTKVPVVVAIDSDSAPAPKRLCHASSLQSTKLPVAVATDSDSPPAPKRRCQNKASSQPSPPNISSSNKTRRYQPVSSPLLKSLSAASTPQGQASPEPTTEQSIAPLSEVSESPMCTEKSIDSPDDESPQGPPVADSESLPIPVPTFRQEKPARVQFGEKQSSTACYFALCKEARKASFDKRRSLHIAAALAAEKEQSSAADGLESEVDDSDDYSDSDDEDESSDEEYDDGSPDVKINGKE
jgi:hypothetical protein